MGSEGPSIQPERWGLILAGGDGTRLRPLTRRIAGDERPKQFCAIVGAETLLDQTRRRSELLISPDQTLMVLTRTHQAFYAPLLDDLPPHCLVIQPEKRGTATAILYGLLRVAAMAPTAPLALFPSDHWVSDDRAFMGHVAAAFQAVRWRPDLVVLLGITPESPEIEYGWIEPGEPIMVPGVDRLYRVRRFREKPSVSLARTLCEGGCLWNSFIMVAHVPALVALIGSATPALYSGFAAIRTALGTLREEEAIRALYSRLPATNFSRQVLVGCPANLAVLAIRGVGWSDLGKPHRAMATLARIGISLKWADTLTAQSA